MNELMEPVAIIGMAGRFPGAANVEEYWNNLRDGRDCIRVPADEELLQAGVKREWLDSPNYIKAVAEAPDQDLFDAQFFGMTPREATLCDPQFRLFLESSHAAVENAGYKPESLGHVGVYGSTGRQMPQIRPENPAVAPDLLAGVLNFADYVSILVSYKLNLTGPAMTVLSACSSSLLTVQLAAQALRVGDCDLALAGGVELNFPAGHGYWWSPGSPCSRDGRCRPFDSAASGTVFGTGAGVVLLKRLSAAIADGDNIRAVIRGIVANNDGSDKVGFSAPSVSGQMAAIAEAVSISELGPQDISYVEAHGTGTTLGDPIEVAALNQAYQRLAGNTELPAGHCGLGSVKANIGHLSHASGIASLIKVILALEHEELPPSINITEPNPKLALDGSPFYLNDHLQAWPREAERPRRAGVNSLGFGGTNVHAIVEESPVRARSTDHDREQILVWSAKTSASEQEYQSKLADHLIRNGGQNLADVAATLQDGRTAHPVRAALVCRDAAEAAAALQNGGKAIVRPPQGRGDARRLAFLFPGQGSQHTHMAQHLYATDRTFGSNIDTCFDLMGAKGTELRAAWSTAADAKLQNTLIAQPLLFAVEYSLAQMWRSFGIRPDAVLGHSVGELVAAAVAGIIELPDAIRLVMARAEAMAAAPSGAMLAVSESDVPQPPDQDVVIAAVNGPNQVVFSGPADKIARFARLLTKQKITHRKVPTSHAFHHPLMAPAATAFAEAFHGVTLSPPQSPFYSAASAGLLTNDDALRPSFWADQLIRPVLFGQALDELLGTGDWLVLEVGPDRVLSSIARGHPDIASGRHGVLSSLPRRSSAADQDWKSVLDALAGLWAEGRDVQWAEVRQGEPARRLALPGYQYQRSHYWYKAPEKPPAREQDQVRSGGEQYPGHSALEQDQGLPDHQPTELAAPADISAAGRDDEAGPSGPFTAVAWVESPRPAVPASGEGRTALALLPSEPVASSLLIRALQRAGLRITPVWRGEEYREGGIGFHARAAEPGDLERVFAVLAERDEDYPELLVHAWGFHHWDRATIETIDGQLDESFNSLIRLVQTGRRQPDGRRPQRLVVLTSQAADVSGSEDLSPAKSTLPALIRTLNLEAPHMQGRLIDVQTPVSEDELVAEIRLTSESGIVALRGDRRWIPAERSIDPAPIESTPLRRSGVYLITGGLGGIGLEVAKGLTRTGLGPRLALIGRTAPADQNGSPRGTQGNNSRGAQISGQLDEMRALGAEVRTFAADVTDERAMRRVLDTVTATFGPVNGVLHLAGVPGGGILEMSAPDDARATLAPKVHGALVLEKVFANRPPLDFFVAFGSRTALDGDAGGGAYAAANAFLDAHTQTSQIASGRLLSIDWAAWNTVGMVAAETSDDAPAPTHRWVTVLSPESYPILDEHRVTESRVAILPGASILDFALRAFRSEVSPEPDIPARLEDVAFRAPVVVNEPRQFQVLLHQDGDRWRFTIQSAPDSASGGEPIAWLTHATGRVADAAGSTPGQVDIESLRSRMVHEEPIPPLSGSERFFALGPRFDNIASTWATSDGTEKLVTISLPEAFESDLEIHLLHPTLLDSATSQARNFTEPFHLPYVYSSLQAYEPLPRTFLSHIRRRTSPDGLIIADVDLLTAEGRIIATITGYTMRMISSATFSPDENQPSSQAAAAGPANLPASADGKQKDPGRGIKPRVGVQLLLRLLESRVPRQVGILPYRNGRPAILPGIPAVWVSGGSPAPQPAPPPSTTNSTNTTSTTTGARPPEPAQAAGPPKPAGPPKAAIPAQRTADDVEVRLLTLWSAILGISEINSENDFFDLGGNSLSAVNLMTGIQEEFAIDLEVSVLFECPTPSSLAAAIKARLT